MPKNHRLISGFISVCRVFVFAFFVFYYSSLFNFFTKRTPILMGEYWMTCYETDTLPTVLRRQVG